MKKKSGKKKTVKHWSLSRKSFQVQEVSKNYLLGCYDPNVLKEVEKYLAKQKRKSKLPTKERCPEEDATEDRIDQQVKLRCRQLTNVVQELRKAIMRQDWDEVTTLLMILCHPGLKYYSSIILRGCFILLCNHPDSNSDLLKNFIRQITQYILEEDVNKFIKVLFALRKSEFNCSGKGKFVRRIGDYKVVTDPEFEHL